jgi:hypothetical protein
MMFVRDLGLRVHERSSTLVGTLVWSQKTSSAAKNRRVGLK